MYFKHFVSAFRGLRYKDIYGADYVLV